MRYTLALTLACTIALALTTSDGEAAPRAVSAAEVNGTWQSKSGTFKVWALGRQRLKVEFSGSHEYGAAMANSGEAHGVARIDGDTAIFEPRGAGRCRIAMKFERAKLVANQEGECGFGLNVSAEGIYTKKSRRKPRFDD
jgi:hypothetical protein